MRAAVDALVRQQSEPIRPNQLPVSDRPTTSTPGPVSAPEARRLSSDDVARKMQVDRQTARWLIDTVPTMHAHPRTHACMHPNKHTWLHAHTHAHMHAFLFSALCSCFGMQGAVSPDSKRDVALQPDPAPHPAGLPAGWSEQRDPEGRVFYVNTQTGQSQWQHPAQTSPPPRPPISLPEPSAFPRPPPGPPPPEPSAFPSGTAEQTCPICRVQKSESMLSRLPCGHVACTACVSHRLAELLGPGRARVMKAQGQVSCSMLMPSGRGCDGLLSQAFIQGHVSDGNFQVTP